MKHLSAYKGQSSSAQANQGMSLNSLELMPDDIRTNKNQAPPSVPENIESRVEQVCVWYGHLPHV